MAQSPRFGIRHERNRRGKTPRRHNQAVVPGLVPGTHWRRDRAMRRKDDIHANRRSGRLCPDRRSLRSFERMGRMDPGNKSRDDTLDGVAANPPETKCLKPQGSDPGYSGLRHFPSSSYPGEARGIQVAAASELYGTTAQSKHIMNIDPPGHSPESMSRNAKNRKLFRCKSLIVRNFLLKTTA